MISDEYYIRKRIILLVSISIVVYLCSILFIAIQAKAALTSEQLTSNYDKSFKSTFDLGEIKDYTAEDKNTAIPLVDVEYNISSMYLDHTEIEKARIKQKEEYELQQTKNLLNSKPLTKKVEGSMLLPNIGDSSFKGYMCIHKVRSKSSKQYQFLSSGTYDITSDENGIIKYGDYYVVAMASYYTNYKTGSTFRITLSSGVVFDVIAGDMKSDTDTDPLKMYRPKGSDRGEIIEFIVACGEEDESCTKYTTLSDKIKRDGTLSSLGFQGDVVKIEKLEDTQVLSSLYS